MSDSKSVTYGNFEFRAGGQTLNLPMFGGEVVPDASGGIIVKWGGAGESGITRVYNGEPIYTVATPEAGSSGISAVVTGESDRFFVSENGNLVAYNLVDGIPLWNASIYEIKGATEDGGIIVQIHSFDDEYIQLDNSGNAVGLPIALSRYNAEYVDNGQWLVPHYYPDSVDIADRETALSQNLAQGSPKPTNGNASGQRTVTRNVKFRQLQSCNGYADKTFTVTGPSANPRVVVSKTKRAALMVPAGGGNTIAVRVGRQTRFSAPHLQFSPNTITTNPYPNDYISVQVTNTDNSEHISELVTLIDTWSNQPVGSFWVDVLKPRTINVALFNVFQPGANSLATSTSQWGDFQAELDRVYKPQANLSFNIDPTIYPLSCSYDSNTDSFLTSPGVRLKTTNSEDKKIEDCAKQNSQFTSLMNNTKYIKVFSVLQPATNAGQPVNGFAYRSGFLPNAASAPNETGVFVRGFNPREGDLLDQSLNTAAHEIGHHLGLPHDWIDTTYLMWFQSGLEPRCDMNRSEWLKVTRRVDQQ